MQTPELYLLALAQFATTADTEVVSMPITLELTRSRLLRIPPRCFPMFPTKRQGILLVVLPVDDSLCTAGPP